MGLSISCHHFEHFSSVLEWLVQSRMGVAHTAHYLDDFLFSGPPGTGTCERLLKTFMDTCQELGVPLAHEKTEGPDKCLTFLGVELDSKAQQSRLPQAKLDTAIDLLKATISATKITLYELQVLVGYLNFTCRVIAPGRAFLRHLCDAMAGVKRSTHRIRITAAMCADLGLWLTFLEHFNRVSFWVSHSC